MVVFSRYIEKEERKGGGRGEMRKDKLEKRWGRGLGRKREKKCWFKV